MKRKAKRKGYRTSRRGKTVENGKFNMKFCHSWGLTGKGAAKLEGICDCFDDSSRRMFLSNYFLGAGAQKSRDDSDSGWEITYKNLISSLTSYSWTFTKGSPSKGDDTIRGACRPYLATNSKRVFTSVVAGLRLEITEALKEASLSMVITQHFSSFLRTHKSSSPFQCQGKIFWSFKTRLE